MQRDHDWLYGPTAAKWAGYGPPVALALALALAIVGCVEDPASSSPRSLNDVHWPGPTVRLGTRIFASGQGVDGARLLLRAPGVDLLVDLGAGEPVPVEATGLPANGRLASGLVQTPATPLTDGTEFKQACLVAAEGVKVGEQDDCVTISATWRTDLTAPTLELKPATHRFGESLPIVIESGAEPGGALLLPGEGEAWLDVVAIQAPAPIQATATIALLPLLQSLDDTTWSAWSGPTGWDRRRRRLRFDPAWLGPSPGNHHLQIRLRQRAGAADAAGPWLPWKITISPPQLDLPKNAERKLKRGQFVPATLNGVPAVVDGQGWRLVFSGTWSGAGAQITWPDGSPRRLPGGSWQGSDGPVQGALLSSAAWFLGGWQAVDSVAGDAELAGRVAVEIFSAAGSWRSPGKQSTWRLQPTRQRLALHFGVGFTAGLQRFGLAARAATIETRVRELVAEDFAGLRLDLLASGQIYDADGEVLQVAILDRDPNGLDLLGADNSPGKDVGNRFLGERLLGFSPAARVADEVAYGGVFLNGFARFSPTLHPAGLVADAKFDTIFGPWMPELGGKAAAVDDPDVAEAVEIMARLIAGSITHEAGHALGLPAVAGYHHSADNPGWRMDEGRFRPFAERAGLTGADKEVWGSVDGPYLEAILGGG